MPAPPRLASVLPYDMPADDHARLALFAIRRMGAHGLGDAHTSQAMLAAFGVGFRRPLMLLRALMADLSASATGPIAIAPCCCPRMTVAEASLIATIGHAERDPGRARFLLADLLDTRRVDGVLASAAAVSAAFADAGRPIS